MKTSSFERLDHVGIKNMSGHRPTPSELGETLAQTAQEGFLLSTFQWREVTESHHLTIFELTYLRAQVELDDVRTCF